MKYVIILAFGFFWCNLSAQNYGQIGQPGGTLAGGMDSIKVAILEHIKADSVNSDTISASTWGTFTLTENYDDIGITVSTGSFTLPTGKYYLCIRHGNFSGTSKRSRLANTTDSTYEYGISNNNMGMDAVVKIASAKSFEYQFYHTSDLYFFPDGVPATSEKYLIISIIQLTEP